MKRFALAGNPNCGKTTLFNSLTGSTAHVGNWPGVTVDKKEGTYKKCAEPISIVDLPGIYSLSPYTPEEVISRNYILEEKPDCVINIVDATNLERNLYLTTQIMEIDVPMIIALNMMDTVEKNGDKIDAKSLEEKIGLPVVEISALREKGLDELMQRAYEVCRQPRKGRTVLEGTQLTHLINDCRIALEGSGVENSLFHAVKLVELDEIEVGQHPQAAQMVEEFKKTFKDDVFGTDFEAIVADARYKYISKNYSSVVTKKEKNEKEKLSVSDKADKVLTHKVWGIPIFILILFLVFHLTFAEDFLFLGAGGVFDKDVVAYLDASATQAAYFAQTPYDKDTTYYTEDGFKADLTFTDDGELEAVEAKPYASISVNCAVFVFGKMLQDIIAVDYRGVGIKRIVRCPAPVVAFIPVGIFRKPSVMPTDSISGNMCKLNIFAKASVGMNAVNDNRLTIPLFFIFSNGYRNFDEFAVIFRKVSIKASSSKRRGFQFIVVKFNLFLYVFRNRFYLFNLHFI